MLLLPEPVRFVKLLEDTSYHLGHPLSLTCTYTGSQLAYVSWTKDGKPIWASYKYNIKSTDSSCVLEVLNSDREEAAGVYSCQVSNAESSAICDAYVFCKTAKKGITTHSLLTTHSLASHHMLIHSYSEQRFHPTPRLVSEGFFHRPFGSYSEHLAQSCTTLSGRQTCPDIWFVLVTQKTKCTSCRLLQLCGCGTVKGYQVICWSSLHPATWTGSIS